MLRVCSRKTRWWVIEFGQPTSSCALQDRSDAGLKKGRRNEGRDSR